MGRPAAPLFLNAGLSGNIGTALWRGYLLKEGLRAVFRAPPGEAAAEFDRWLAWALPQPHPAVRGALPQGEAQAWGHPSLD